MSTVPPLRPAPRNDSPRPGDNPAAVDAAGRQELIEELCSFEGRGPGTDAERRAANWLAERLRAIGPPGRGRADLRPPPVRRSSSRCTASLAIAGSLLAALAARRRLRARAARRHLALPRPEHPPLPAPPPASSAAPPRTSSPPAPPDAPARLVLSAHYDAAQDRLRLRPPLGRASRGASPSAARVLLGPIRLIFWGGIVPLLLDLRPPHGRLDAGWLSIVQLVPTVLLLVSIFLLIDIALSDVVPGAYDNASGVAAVLSAAEGSTPTRPPNLDVWVVLPGAEECNAEGMARCVARPPQASSTASSTFFVNLDSVSYGDVHYLRQRGRDRQPPDGPPPVRALRGGRRRADRRAATGYAARPIRIPLHTDALPALVRGFRAISIVGLSDGVGAAVLPHPRRHPGPASTARR